jgi:hypothetical protein
LECIDHVNAGIVTDDALHKDALHKGVVLKESLIGASSLKIEGKEKAETKVNYFIGGEPNWRTSVPSYNIVSLGEVYPKIEAHLKAYGNNVEKVFCVEKGGDPNKIMK